MARESLRGIGWVACIVIAGLVSGAWIEAAPPVEAESDKATSALLRRFIDEMVEITPGEGKFPGEFEMGASDGAPEERPVHTVTLREAFWMGAYEVPQNLYEAVMGENPSRWQGPRNSVERMTWFEANEFCKRMTRALREAKLIDASEEIRLPTEVEWEYCCRAGTTTAYSFGDQAQAPGEASPKASLLDPYAWHTGNAAGNDPPVGALKPNPWGLYDMHGYLWEFCGDDWFGSYEQAPDKNGVRKEPESEACVIRGGSWKNAFPALRSAARQAFRKQGRDDAVGFRCVRARVATQ